MVPQLLANKRLACNEVFGESGMERHSEFPTLSVSSPLLPIVSRNF